MGGRGTQDITDAETADLLEYIGKTEYLKRSEGGQIKPRGVGKALRGWGNKEKRQKGGQIMAKKNRMSRVGLSPAEETRAGTQSETERKRYKKGGDVKVAGRGSKKGKPSRPKPQKPPKMFAQHGGMVQGYDARKDEQLGMTRGPERDKDMSMAARRKVAKATRKPKGTYGLVRRAKGGPIGIRAALRGHGAVRKT